MDPEQHRAQELAELRQRVEWLEQEVARLRTGDVARVQRVDVVRETVRTPEMVSVKVQAASVVMTSPMSGSVAMQAEARPARSLEDQVGSQIFNRIGIAALLIGLTWFLKLAMDNHWIGQSGRVAIGLIAGAALVLWSERFRRQGYAAFSYSLKAVGSGALYLSLWAGFHLYHLMPAAVALGAMVLVTAWNAFMAWAQDAEMLAAYALIGGFASPALVSSGGNHEIFLFTYVLAMDLAVLALVRLKPWQRLLLGAMPATAVYFMLWYVAWFNGAHAAGVTALFATLLFAAMAAVGLVAEQRDGVIAGVLAPAAAAAFGALTWYSVLEDSGRHSWLPWEMVAFSALYLALARGMRGREKELPAGAVHLSMAVVFLTVAIPLKASGHWITVGWLVEGVALLRVAARTARGEMAAGVGRLLRVLASLALTLGWIGATVHVLSDYAKHAVWNTRFATGMMGVAAMAAVVLIAAMQDEESGPEWTAIGAPAMIAGNLLAVLAGVEEIITYWGTGAELGGALAISGFLMAYGAALLAVGFWRRAAFVRWQGLVLLLFTIGKVFVYDMRSLSSGYRVLSFIGLGALLMAVSFAYQKDWLGLRHADAEGAE